MVSLQLERHSSFIRATLVAGIVLIAGCMPRRAAVVGPVPDVLGTASLLQNQTNLEDTIRIIFAWELNDAGVRVRGRGVARVEPPYKARLDLFLDNGESVIRAALVDGELRLPAGAPDDILPPPDLMWGTLGVFRPESDAELVGGDRLDNGLIRLRYRYLDGTELHYATADGVLRKLEMLSDGEVVQWVEVDPDEETRYPARATYRNLVDFRELKITRQQLDRVEAYPADIWDPRAP
jgi:hypothetical protein